MQRCAMSDLSGHARRRRASERPEAVHGSVRRLPGSHERAAVLGDGGIRHLQQGDLRAERARGAHHVGRARSTVCETLKAAGVTPFYGTFKDPWTIAQGWYDYTVGGTVDVARLLRRARRGGHGGRAELGGLVREGSGRARRQDARAGAVRQQGCREPRATATATSRSPRARPRCTCRVRGPSARSRRPAPTSSSAPSRCR